MIRPALALALLAVGAGRPLAAGESASELRLVVIVARHGVRAPTSEASPRALADYARDPWPRWEEPAGYLTAAGARQMRLLGAYYRTECTDAGLFGAPPAEVDAGRVFVRADSDQRTVESARQLAAGLLPGGQVAVHARDADDDPDPLFHPLQAGLGHPDPALAVAAVRERLGDRPALLDQEGAAPLAELERVLLGSSAGEPPPGKRRIGGGRADVVADPKTPGAVVITGSALLAKRCAEDLLLEYADGRPWPEVGWGRMDRSALGAIIALHERYAELTEGTFYLAQEKGSNLLDHLVRTLRQAATETPVPGAIGPASSRLVVLLGHDTNLTNLAGLLGLTWRVDGLAANPTLPGGALVFELRRDRHAGRSFLRIRYVAQTLEELRAEAVLTRDHPPACAPIFIPGCSGAEPGYDAPLESFERLAGRVIDPRFVLASSD